MAHEPVMAGGGAPIRVSRTDQFTPGISRGRLPLAASFIWRVSHTPRPRCGFLHGLHKLICCCPVDRSLLPDHWAKEKPPAVSCRGFFWKVVRRSGSEVALNADVERRRALIFEGVGLRRLRSTRAEYRGSREVLVKQEVHRFGRERQVLHWGPAGDYTDLGSGEVRVAGVAGAEARMGRSEPGAEFA